MGDFPEVLSLRKRKSVVVDSFPVMRDAVAKLLKQHRLADVVEKFDTAHSAFKGCLQLRPDFLITDVDLGGSRMGLDLCRSLKQLDAPPQVMVFSSTSAPNIVADCISSGADSFVHRSADPAYFVTAVRAMIGDRPVWYAGEDHEASIDVACIGPNIAQALTNREQEVLALLLQRYSNPEISNRLFLARQTVKNYVSSILQKLELSSRHELLTTYAESSCR
ncbi:response regulator transcription factor [Streptomyces sp. NPDC001793]|uniref:response regulator transcription factor n=1 Tax=Streptomyces sp. NPDC001793 TaxID=3154657 RepID=UPI003318C7A6